MAKKAKPAILYISRSSSILEERVAAVKKGIKGKVNLDTDYKVYENYETMDLADMVTFLSTPSFFSDNKVLILKNLQDCPSSLLKGLAAELDKLDSGGNFLVMTSTTEKLNPQFLKAARSHGTIKKIKEPTAENAKSWLKEKAELDGIKFSGRALESFLESVEYRLDALKREYEKLYCYASGQQDSTVDQAAVSRLVTRVYNMQIFDLVDFIGKRDKAGALQAMDAMVQLNQDMVKVSLASVTLLHRLFKSMAYFAHNLDQEGQDYIRENIRSSTYMQNRVIAKYKKFASGYRPGQLARILGIINKYDRVFRDTQKAADHMFKMIIEIMEA